MMCKYLNGKTLPCLSLIFKLCLESWKFPFESKKSKCSSPLPTKNCTKPIQNVYKKYTKQFVYILYTKIVQIKILFDNECTKNVHQIPTYI